MSWSEADDDRKSDSESDAESSSATNSTIRMDADEGPGATGYCLQQIQSALPNAAPRIELRGSQVCKVL